MNKQTPIPKEELEIFRNLKDVKVVFDVGARTDSDYLNIKPKAVYHLFEPNPEFFKELKAKIKRKNVFFNNYGLGDKKGIVWYKKGNQSFVDSDNVLSMNTTGDWLLPIKTLDWYIKKNNIKRLDFLKIDTEGFDYRVLIGGKKALKMAKYIQYEHWDDKECFHKLLEKDFNMEYIGNRNVLCTRK